MCQCVCSPGEELGEISACCAEATGHYLIVEQLQKVATLSQHSSKFRMARATRAVWRMCDVALCAAWKVEHDEITAIAI